MDFIAMDFETANCHPTSACSLGIAVVQNGIVSERHSWLIRPEPFYFDPFTTAIHGIHAGDVADAPTFGQLWPEISSYFEGAIVAAHHAAFDIGVLQSTLAFYGIAPPPIRILCTLLLSRRAFPKAASHRLNAISEALHIPLDHHKAESDAVACAQILCILMHQNGLATLEDLKGKFGLLPGFLSATHPSKPCRLCPVYSLPRELLEQWQSHAIPDENFYDKSFVFAGRLVGFPKRKAMEAIIRGGGVVLSGLTSYTDYLVLGDSLLEQGSSAARCTKERQALLLQQKGFPIQILTQSQFLFLMGENLRRACFPDGVWGQQPSCFKATSLDAPRS